LCKILVLVSGGGSNLRALIDAEKRGRLGPGSIAAVAADRPCYALERAKAAGMETVMEGPDPGLPRQDRRRDLSDRILRICREREIGLVILAGFLSILEGELIAAYAGRIINLHPSLLPQFGGPGMYGERVHRAVLAAGKTRSGCTVHVVDAGTDTGPILLQRPVPVRPGDTPATLAERIHREEHIAIVKAAALMAKRLDRTPEPAAPGILNLTTDLTSNLRFAGTDEDDNKFIRIVY
jgi:phosphoribosylglycinamide formyltransferase-1